MYVASPHWRFEAVRPPRRGTARLRTALVTMGVTVAIVFALSKTVAGVGLGGYVTYQVQPGDTLWSIASERYPGSDVRERVGEIEQENGITDPVIVPGESLKVPQS